MSVDLERLAQVSRLRRDVEDAQRAMHAKSDALDIARARLQVALSEQRAAVAAHFKAVQELEQAQGPTNADGRALRMEIARQFMVPVVAGA